MSGRRWIVLMSLFFVLVGLSLGVTRCPLQAPSSLTGDSAAGSALFSEVCSGCHSAAFLKGNRNRIVTNLGSLNSQMSGITLTEQDVADLKAFLATQ